MSLDCILIQDKKNLILDYTIRLAQLSFTIEHWRRVLAANLGAPPSSTLVSLHLWSLGIIWLVLLRDNGKKQEYKACVLKKLNRVACKLVRLGFEGMRSQKMGYI